MNEASADRRCYLECLFEAKKRFGLWCSTIDNFQPHPSCGEDTGSDVIARAYSHRWPHGQEYSQRK